MSLTKGLQRRPLIAIATVIAFLVSAGTAVWYSSKLPAQASVEDKENIQSQLRKGIGSEVRFASRPEQALEATESVAAFIHSRSGMKLSDELKKETREGRERCAQRQVAIHQHH